MSRLARSLAETGNSTAMRFFTGRSARLEQVDQSLKSGKTEQLFEGQVIVFLCYESHQLWRVGFSALSSGNRK